MTNGNGCECGAKCEGECHCKAKGITVDWSSPQLAELKKDAEAWKTCAEGLKEALGLTATELAALKKDAREIAEFCKEYRRDNSWHKSWLDDPINRILAATEEK